jgi:RimJ/RimL family protein N-acetyltransferase
MIDDTTFKNEFISLRPICKNDLQFLVNWKNSEETYRYLGGGFHPVSENQYEKWLDNMIDMTGNARRFIILDKNNNAIGMIGLYSINWIHRTCEIGVFIGDEKARGNGYASMACRMVENYAKNYMNIRKIKLLVVKNNSIALKMWQNLGYSKIGEYSEERFINGQYCNVVIMEKFL